MMSLMWNGVPTASTVSHTPRNSIGTSQRRQFCARNVSMGKVFGLPSRICINAVLSHFLLEGVRGWNRIHVQNAAAVNQPGQRAHGECAAAESEQIDGVAGIVV